jgi:GNAT superfamily N-acetyltransferase
VQRSWFATLPAAAGKKCLALVESCHVQDQVKGMNFLVRRLVSEDAGTYQRLRVDGLRRHPECFRVAPEEEAALPLQTVAATLESSFVLGGFHQGLLVGIASLSAFSGAKVQHKALLWGMYVLQDFQGHGLADQLIEGLLKEAKRSGLQQVQLTVVAQNSRASRIYQRWGFELYATEAKAVKFGETYLDEQLRVCWIR